MATQIGLRLLACVLCVALSLPAAPVLAGDLNAEVNAMFNNLGAIGNYTAPGAFKSQIYNTYAGGSFYMRSPSKTYTLASIQFPNARGGCGGIDAFAGSFSHISGQEFKNMIKNITAALPGVAFQVALDVLSPLLGGVSKQLQGLLEMVNGRQINSCQTAIGLVRSAAEKMAFDVDEACAKVYVWMNGGDQAQGQLECQKQRTSILNQARSNPNPEIRELVPLTGNLVWKALKTVNTIDDKEREFIMSMTGTYVYPREDANGAGVQYAAQLTSVRQLLYGSGDAGDGKIRLTLLRCNDYTDCENPYMDDSYVHTGFLKRTMDIMHSISDKIRDRQALPNDSEEVGFVNSVSEPVYRMLSIGNTNTSLGMADGLINQYAGVIAADYAYTFLERNLRLGLTALMRTYKLNKSQEEDMARLSAAARGTLAGIGQEKATLYTKVQSFASIASHLEMLERQLRAGMPQNVVDMLGYQAAFMTK